MSQNIYENDVLISDLNNQIKSLEEEKQDLESQLDKAKLKKDKLAETENIIKEKQRIPNLSAATIDKLVEMSASVFEQIGDMNAQIAGETAKLQDVSMQILHLSDKIKERERQLENESGEAAEDNILAELENLEGIKQAEITIENNEVSMNIIDDDGEIAKIKKEIENVKAQRTEVQAENDRLSQKYQDEIAKLNNKLKIIEEKHNTPGISDATSEKLDEMYDEVEAQIDEYTDKIDELYDNLDEFNDRIEELEELLEETENNGIDEELISSLEEQLAEINSDKSEEQPKSKNFIESALDALNINIPEIKIPEINIPHFDIKIPSFNFNNQDKNEKSDDEMTFDDILSLAPFASRETLDKLVDKLDITYDFHKIVSLAPFLSKSTLDKLVDKCEITNNIENIAALAPFLSKGTLDKLVDKCENEIDFNKIVSLAPFLSKESMKKLIYKSNDKINFKMLQQLAPFLDRNTIDDIINGIENI